MNCKAIIREIIKIDFLQKIKKWKINRRKQNIVYYNQDKLLHYLSMKYNKYFTRTASLDCA